MKRRYWVLAWGAGLWVGLMPGCASTPDPRPLAVSQGKEAFHPSPDQRLASNSPAGSPYHAVSPETGNNERPANAEIEQAQYPKPVVSEGPALPPAPPTRVQYTMEPGSEVAVAHEQEAVPDARAADEPLVAALRCFMKNRPVDAIGLLKDYPKTNQDLLLCLLPLVARLTEGGSPAEIKGTAALVEQLDSLLSPYRAKAPLTIDKMCFCRRIEDFGEYEPLPEGHLFRPEEEVRVYVEVRNFTCEKREIIPGQTRYETRLACSAEIRNYTGDKVLYLNFHRDKPDLRRSERHDYFDNYRFLVPDLPPGPYVLKIEVEDVPTQRKKWKTLDFQVTRPPARGS